MYTRVMSMGFQRRAGLLAAATALTACIALPNNVASPPEAHVPTDATPLTDADAPPPPDMRPSPPPMDMAPPRDTAPPPPPMDMMPPPPAMDATPDQSPAPVPDQGPVDAAPVTPCEIEPESCDGLDNDCDDIVDESEDEGGACRCVAAPIEPVDLCNREVSWPTALAACRARGGSLAVIHNDRAWAHLSDALRLYEDEFEGSDMRMWIGLNDREAEGDFVWADGEDAAYRDWHDFEPNDLHGEDCVNTVLRGERLAWNDKVCDHLHVFMCSRD